MSQHYWQPSSMPQAQTEVAAPQASCFMSSQHLPKAPHVVAASCNARPRSPVKVCLDSGQHNISKTNIAYLPSPDTEASQQSCSGDILT